MRHPSPREKIFFESVDLENSNFLGKLIPDARTLVSEFKPSSCLVVFAVLLLVATSCEGRLIEGCGSIELCEGRQLDFANENLGPCSVPRTF